MNRQIKVCFLDYFPRQPEQKYYFELLREDYDVIIDHRRKPALYLYNLKNRFASYTK